MHLWVETKIDRSGVLSIKTDKLLSETQIYEKTYSYLEPDNNGKN